MSKKQSYQQRYTELYLYTYVTSILLGTEQMGEVETPFHEEGRPLYIQVRKEAVHGIGNHQFQRELLEANRGKLILFNDGHATAVIGRFDKNKKNVVLYVTTTFSKNQQKILHKLQKHLDNNNISVTISIDEQERRKHQKRMIQGDFVIRR